MPQRDGERVSFEQSTRRAAIALAEPAAILSPLNDWVMAATFVAAVAVPAVTPDPSHANLRVAARLAALAAELPLRHPSVRRHAAIRDQSGDRAIGYSEADDDEAWCVGIDGNGLASVIYLHPVLRPARLPPKPVPALAWTEPLQSRVVAEAIGTAHRALREICEFSWPKVPTEALALLAAPGKGESHRSAHGHWKCPVRSATRWTADTDFVQVAHEVLAELSLPNAPPFD